MGPMRKPALNFHAIAWLAQLLTLCLSDRRERLGFANLKRDSFENVTFKSLIRLGA